MSTQDKTEKILRELHIMAAKGESVPAQPEKVALERQAVLDLLTELNSCMYEIMDEHEMTLRSRDKAERDFQKKQDEIVKDATNNAEDIYAAAFMYTDEALLHVQDIMRENVETIEKMFKELKENLQEQTRRVKSNQLELKSQLQDFRDTEKYLKLIEERNREIEKQKTEGAKETYEPVSIYAGRTTDIKVNTDYFEKLGITPEEEVPPESEPVRKAEVIIKTQEQAGDAQEPARQDVPESVGEEQVSEEADEGDLQIMTDLDAEYFQWVEEKEKENEKGNEKPDGKEPAKDLTEGIHKMWKSLTSRA